jgi:hypothetical protein
VAVDVFVADDEVRIDISGFDVVLCLARSIRLPMADVVGARVAPVAEIRDDVGWRLAGGYLPGVLATGWFTVRGRKGLRQFLHVFRDPEVLVIDTARQRPWRVVLQHPDRDRLAWLIAERLPGRPGAG